MACFLVPGTEAIVVSAVAHTLKKKERHEAETHSTAHTLLTSTGMKLALLANLLWGGTVLLAFEHLWHGEISPFFPFLTAVGTNAMASTVQEMATVGVGMALAVTAVWGVIIAVIKHVGRSASTTPQEA
ncbi:MAG: hypothetical protein MR006_07130 [Arcanobacterium sp.]|nr:hypothetical protein [Arcanobacterium sp.]MDY5588787.1 hypothetical protein [Arcanobacterium sp.]